MCVYLSRALTPQPYVFFFPVPLHYSRVCLPRHHRDHGRRGWAARGVTLRVPHGAAETQHHLLFLHPDRGRLPAQRRPRPRALPRHAQLHGHEHVWRVVYTVTRAGNYFAQIYDEKCKKSSRCTC